jgi:hypothetical protein
MDVALVFPDHEVLAGVVYRALEDSAGDEPLDRPARVRKFTTSRSATVRASTLPGRDSSENATAYQLFGMGSATTGGMRFRLISGAGLGSAPNNQAPAAYGGSIRRQHMTQAERQQTAARTSIDSITDLAAQRDMLFFN